MGVCSTSSPPADPTLPQTRRPSDGGGGIKRPDPPGSAGAEHLVHFVICVNSEVKARVGGGGEICTGR